MRRERDTIGEVEVPDDKFFGAQTMRSFLNFPIGDEKVPMEVVRALCIVKKASASVNASLGLLDKKIADHIISACNDVIVNNMDEHFPLVVWQTGSGTHSNMNVNEVISNLAIQAAGGELGSKDPVHPNDHVNKGQSSNDVFPTASNIAAVVEVHEHLLPNLRYFHKALVIKSKEFADVVKVGRTHLMDATPITLGQEFSGYATMIEKGIRLVEKGLDHLYELAIGGTAVGTGINTHPEFAVRVADEIAKQTSYPFVTAPNKFEALSASDAIVEMSGITRRLAGSMLKIANDIAWLASGPRSGIGELEIPANEPGSSIMPGKVNPTQSESMAMVAVEVMGNDTTISIAGSQGNFELNVFRPVMIYNLLRSVCLIGDSVKSFTDNCLDGLKPRMDRINQHLDNSLMLVTALNPIIGYDKAAQIAKKAYSENKTLREAALELNFLSAEEFDKAIDPASMTKPK